MRVSLGWVLSLLLQAASSAFESELAPGQNRLLYRWETSAPQLRAEPSHSSGVVRTLVGVRNRLIEYDFTRYRTVAAGSVVALRDGSVTGRSFGQTRSVSRFDYYRERHPSGSWPVVAGDTVLYLQYRSEGTCFVQLQATVIEAQPCPIEQPKDWKTVRDAQTELWIRVTALGEPLGWVLAGPSITKVYTP